MSSANFARKAEDSRADCIVGTEENSDQNAMTVETRLVPTRITVLRGAFSQ